MGMHKGVWLYVSQYGAALVRAGVNDVSTKPIFAYRLPIHLAAASLKGRRYQGFCRIPVAVFFRCTSSATHVRIQWH